MVIVGLHVHRFDDVLILDIREEIPDKVVFPELGIGPPNTYRFRAPHVGIVVVVDIPQMVMRIDDLHREGSPGKLGKLDEGFAAIGNELSPKLEEKGEGRQGWRRSHFVPARFVLSNHCVPC